MNEAQKIQAAGIITVFSPGAHCVQCRATYRNLDAAGIEYRVIEVAEDDDATRGTLRELGFQQFPVVWAPGVGYWAGFRPDKLDELANEVAR
jgi:glutaredoxin-like protein NrdH